MRNILFIVLAIFIVGCKVQSGVSTDSQESVSALETNQVEVPSLFALDSSIQKKDSLFASIEKGLCFGNCPTYHMHIYNNGDVTLKAIRGIEKKGMYLSSLTDAQMTELVLKAEEIHFTEMNEVYDNKSVTDLPMVSTSIVLNGKRKVVKRRYNYPKEILELEKLFDSLLNKLTWEKIQDSSSN